MKITIMSPYGKTPRLTRSDTDIDSITLHSTTRHIILDIITHPSVFFLKDIETHTDIPIQTISIELGSEGFCYGIIFRKAVGPIQPVLQISPIEKTTKIQVSVSFPLAKKDDLCIELFEKRLGGVSQFYKAMPFSKPYKRVSIKNQTNLDNLRTSLHTEPMDTAAQTNFTGTVLSNHATLPPENKIMDYRSWEGFFGAVKWYCDDKSPCVSSLGFPLLKQHLGDDFKNWYPPKL